MILYRATIADADCHQLLDIKGRLANLEQRVDEILPMSQFNAFFSPSDDVDHPKELNIWVSIEGELTRPQISILEREIESTAGERLPARAARSVSPTRSAKPARWRSS